MKGYVGVLFFLIFCFLTIYNEKALLFIGDIYHKELCINDACFEKPNAYYVGFEDYQNNVYLYPIKDIKTIYLTKETGIDESINLSVKVLKKSQNVFVKTNDTVCKYFYTEEQGLVGFNKLDSNIYFKVLSKLNKENTKILYQDFCSLSH